MNGDIKNVEEVAVTPTETGEVVAAPIKEIAKKPQMQSARGGRGERGDRGRRGRAGRGGPRRAERSEYDQKIISIRRVARVVAGGRRFNFSVAMVIGNRKGSVGVGLGKGADTASAIEKALRDAKKHMIKLPLTPQMRIPHEVTAKYASSVIMIKPVPGRGLVAGSSARTVLELAGVTDVIAKIYSRSKNRLNNAMVAITALKGLRA